MRNSLFCQSLFCHTVLQIICRECSCSSLCDISFKIIKRYTVYKWGLETDFSPKKRNTTVAILKEHGKWKSL
ncbi:hypothetical protein TNCT_212681 [Trichonephila clavata]|uniref:Uncharacterized protein n=1 Tax=Trichonephila clavata TaxID=2740835 RepID=A0A8X6LF24_TRICU|nr:hypothetical protein TNCT_212681 [Trichonephila clavata]